MSSYIQKYPLLDPAKSIGDLKSLPLDAKIIAHIVDSTERIKNYYFIKQDNTLSICTEYKNTKTNAVRSNQFDYPLRVLSWFPRALSEFQKPPAKGGLHAGAMTSQDEEVDGEYLCVQAASQGYVLVNRSRQSPLGIGSSYMPTSLSLSHNFLFNLGLMDLWVSLGEQYEKGLL